MKAPHAQMNVSLNYLARIPKYDEEKPFTCFIDLSGVPEAETTNIVNEAVDKIPVLNVRGEESQLQLDQQGFEIGVLGMQFKDADFHDDKWLKERYYPYICQYLIQKLGAKEAHVFEHQVNDIHQTLGDVQANCGGPDSFVTDILGMETANCEELDITILLWHKYMPVCQ